MIRKLTEEEIARSRAAAKRANQTLSRRRKELFEQVAKLRRVSSTPPYERIARLLDERDAIRNVHGLPVRLAFDGEEFIVNYEFLQKFFRKLKRFTIDITVSETGYLLIRYGRPPHYGQLELRGLPQYQADLLDDLPRVVLEW
jgi:hypothetical protein